MKNKKGFTLIELLVTIALMLSMLGLAIVSFINISNRKKEEAYNLVKDQIITAAEQYFDSNEYLFEGLSDNDNSIGIITVGMLVEEDYLNVVTNPVTGQFVNKCSQVQVTKKNGIYNSEFKEYSDGYNCESNYSVTISEPGAPSIKYVFYRQTDKKEIKVNSEDEWFNINKLGEGRSLGVRVTSNTNNNGKIVGISMCNKNGKGECTNFGDYITNTSSYNDDETYKENTNGKTVCYKVTNISGKSAFTCAFAKVDTEKPSCDLSVSGSSKKENNTTKINYTGWYTSNVYVLIDNMSNDVKKWSWKSDSWNSDEYDYMDTKPSDIKQKLFISGEGKNRYVSVYMKDQAGNENNIIYKNINIDKTAPKCTVSVIGTKGNSANNVDWYRSKVTLEGACDDGSSLSGCVTKKIARAYNAEGKYKDATAGTISDNAGNTRECKYGTELGIDWTAPTMTMPTKTCLNYNGGCGGDTNYYQHEYTINDNLSGILIQNIGGKEGNVGYNHCYDNAAKDGATALLCNGFETNGRKSKTIKYTSYVSNWAGKQNYRYRTGLTGYYHLFYKIIDNAGNTRWYRYRLNYVPKSGIHSIELVGTADK